MELKIITKTSHYVNMYDLCSFLSEKIGRNVGFGESANDTDYSVDVEKGEIDSYDQAGLDGFLATGYINMYYGCNTVFTYCANQGWLEEGSYVFRVSW